MIAVLLLNTFFVAGLLLWPDIIGPEELPPYDAYGKSGIADLPISAGKTVSVPQMPLEKLASLDRRAFILAFERQAQNGLYSCLRNWRDSPSQILVNALLEKKNGRLRSFRIQNGSLEGPECMEEYLKKMDFSSLASSMSQELIDIQWTVSW